MGPRIFPAALLLLLAALLAIAPPAAAQGEALAVVIVLAVYAIPVVVRLAVCWWIYNDAHRRGKSSAVWLVLTLLSPLLGGLLWWMERDKSPVAYTGYFYPPPYQAAPYYAPSYNTAPPASRGGFRPTVSCRGCGTPVPMDSWFCPSCGARQR